MSSANFKTLKFIKQIRILDGILRFNSVIIVLFFPVNLLLRCVKTVKLSDIVFIAKKVNE